MFPSSKSFCVYSVSFPFILMLPSLNVKPSGIESFTETVPSVFPEFCNVIVYVKVSFSYTAPSVIIPFVAVIFTVFTLSGFSGTTGSGFCGVVSLTSTPFSIAPVISLISITNLIST